MTPFWKRLAKSKRGNAMLFVALGMPVLIGGAGYGVDLAQWYLWERELQYAADQAAIAGAWTLTDSATETTYEDRATQEFDVNLGVTSDFADTPVVELADFGAGTDNRIIVSASATNALPFSSFLTGNSVTVAVTAEAIIENGGPPFTACMLALDPSASGAFTLGGNASGAAACGFGALSNSPSAMVKNGNSGTDAGWLVSSGGIDEGFESNGAIHDGVSGLTDPYSELTPPDSPTPRSYSCSGGVATLQPGTYSSISISCATQFSPGVYVIEGDLDFGKNETVTGSDVMFVLQDAGGIHVNSKSNIDMSGITAATLQSYGLSAEEAGKLAGMLFFDTVSDDQLKINGNADIVFDGILYMPKREIWFNGNSSVSGKCMMIAAGKITFTGNVSLGSFCPPTGVDPMNIGGASDPLVRLIA